jgi:hypothetical protein
MRLTLITHGNRDQRQTAQDRDDLRSTGGSVAMNDSVPFPDGTS